MPRYRKLLIGFILIFLLALIACQPTPVSTAVAIAIPTKTPAPTIVNGIRILKPDEVKPALGSESLIIHERVSTLIGRTINYYDVEFERFGRDARMLGQIVIEPSTVDGFIAYYDEGGMKKALPLLYPTEINNSQIIPVLDVKPSGDLKRVEDWQLSYVSETDGATVESLNPFLETVIGGESVRYHFDARYGAFFYCRINNPELCTYERRGDLFTIYLPVTTPAPKRAATIDDISLYGEFSQGQVDFFRNSISLLADLAPNWHKYILNQRPFSIFLDPSLISQDIEGTGRCCDGLRYGVVRIGHVPGDSATQNLEPGHVAFWTTLIHELTHVRDRRAETFARLSGKWQCRALERSAVRTVINFLEDLRLSNLSGDQDANRKSLAFIAEILKSNREALEENTFDWNPNCH